MQHKKLFLHQFQQQGANVSKIISKLMRKGKKEGGRLLRVSDDNVVLSQCDLKKYECFIIQNFITPKQNLTEIVLVQTEEELMFSNITIIE